MNNVIAIVLAGGRGERLRPLTNERAKPAVPFGGGNRIIDFVMNSLVNSGVSDIKVLTQVLSQSLNIHINHFWTSDPLRRQYIDVVPAQMKMGEDWYKGTADAVYQNLNFLLWKDFPLTAIFAGDHILKIDVKQMKGFHLSSNSKFTVCAMPVPVEEAAGNFGVIQVDESGRIIDFEEKPEYPKEIPGRPGFCYASMGIYFADTEYLSEILKKDADIDGSSHDFGKDVVPFIVKNKGRIFAYDFSSNKVPGQDRLYWRDVGTIKAYWEANMDLRNISPQLSLYGKGWPLRTSPNSMPASKFTLGGSSPDSLVSNGCIISGGVVDRSVLSPNVRVERGAYVKDSVIFSSVIIEGDAKVRNAIIDKGVVVPSGMEIGFSSELDLERGLTVQDGITVVPKSFIFN